MSTEVLLLSGGRVEGSVLAALRDARATGDLLWLELQHPTSADFTDLIDVFELHPLAVSDAVGARERPKLDIYGTRPFLSLTTLRRPSPLGQLEVGRVMAWAGEGFVIVVRQEDADTVDRVRAHMRRSSAPAPIEVLHALTDVVVEDLAALSADVERAILDCADRLFAGSHDEAHALYQLTRQLLTMAHAVQPLIEPVRHLSTGALPGTTTEQARRFQDVLDHLVVVDREIADHNALVEHLHGANDSRISLRLNIDMRRIAAWAALIAIPTAVSGFYGMNVPYPGFASAGGAVSAILLQIVLVVVLVVLFRRRSWL